MNDWLVLLTPLLVLPIILLFRFVGCGLNAVGRAPGPQPLPPPPFIPPPDYSQGILDHGNDLVCYWRLVETAMGDAKDEKGRRNGVYVAPGPLAEVPPGPPPSPRNPPGSEQAAGDFQFAQLGLIENEFSHSVRFRGGYVQVAWLAELHPALFTVEAWVLPQWTASSEARRFDHVLIAASQVTGGPSRGFMIYANQFDRWQVRLNSDPASELFPTSQNAGVEVRRDPGGNVDLRTHIAVTYDGTTLTLYIDGVLEGQRAVVYRPVLSPTPLFIGAASPEAGSGSAVGTYPFLGRIQEVALYNKALSAAAISKNYTLNYWP